MKINEIFDAVRHIVINEEYGSAEGYVAPTGAEQLKNWLGYHHVPNATKWANYLQNKYEEFAVLNNINVDEDWRGEGYGSSLLEDWLNDAGAVPVMLIADVAEDNNFSLQSWYEGYGFRVIEQTDSGPLMLLEPE